MSSIEYKRYRRSQIAELADWTPGFDMAGVSVSDADKQAGSPKHGDKIARNPANHADRWLVAADYFAANFEAAIKAAQPEPMSDERIHELAVIHDIEPTGDFPEQDWAAIRAFARALLREAQPDGWVSVPREPTEEMVDSVIKSYGPIGLSQYARGIYRAMLAAAPKETAPEWTPHGVKRQDVCVWMQDSDGAWITSCQQTFEFAHDGPAENHAYFCYHCGGALLPEPYSDDPALEEPI